MQDARFIKERAERPDEKCDQSILLTNGDKLDKKASVSWRLRVKQYSVRVFMRLHSTKCKYLTRSHGGAKPRTRALNALFIK